MAMISAWCRKRSRMAVDDESRLSPGEKGEFSRREKVVELLKAAGAGE